MKKFVASPNNNISKFHISLYIVQRIYRYIRGAEIFLSICVKKTANLNILCRVLLQDTFRGARNFHPEISRKKVSCFSFSLRSKTEKFLKSLSGFSTTFRPRPAPGFLLDSMSCGPTRPKMEINSFRLCAAFFFLILN